MVYSALHKKTQSGFSLIELLIVISIMGVILALAYPNMQRQIAQSRINKTVGDIESAFKTARANALIQKRDVQVSVGRASISVAGTDGFQTPVSSNIVITPEGQSDLGVLTFTTHKTVRKGNSTVGSGQGFGVCYRGVSTTKVIIKVDARSNVNIDKNGGACS